jgi:thymidylate synthase
VRLLVVVQGQWGQRIADHIQQTAPPDWEVSARQGPTAIPTPLDDPAEFLHEWLRESMPAGLPPSDLLLVLTESAGMTDLVPDLAHLCRAEAVIVPVDRRPWAPPGLARQVRQRLEGMGVACVLPMPFCSLMPAEGQHPLIRQFAQRYGRPEVQCAVKGGPLDPRGLSDVPIRTHPPECTHSLCITACHVIREAPCGNTRYVAARLAGTPVDQAVEQAGLLHHYYPCWGGMDVDPVHNTVVPNRAHSLLHIAATMSQKAVERALEDAGDPEQ